MSKQGRTLPNPTTAAPEAPPPDLSGGGDVIMDAPPEGRSTRPGPQPRAAAPIRETFANPGMMTSPDVKVLNERKYDAARSKVRTLAIEKMPDLPVGKHLPGPTPIPVEGEETTTPDAEAETTEAEEPKLDEKTAAQLAAKDRENRELKKKMRAIETSGMSATKKEAKLRELAKTNPRGVADYLGIDFRTYLAQVQSGEQTPVDVDEKVAPETDETTRLREENERLRSAENRRTAIDVVTKKIQDTRDDAGKMRWSRVARVGSGAIQAVTETVMQEVAKMRKLTTAEAHTVLEHFLDEKEAEYRRAAAADDVKPTRQPPNPRRPQTLPAKSPMEMRTAKDESDPRNRPSSREIAARLRARLIGS